MHPAASEVKGRNLQSRLASTIRYFILRFIFSFLAKRTFCCKPIRCIIMVAYKALLHYCGGMNAYGDELMCLGNLYLAFSEEKDRGNKLTLYYSVRSSQKDRGNKLTPFYSVRSSQKDRGNKLTPFYSVRSSQKDRRNKLTLFYSVRSSQKRQGK